MNTLLVLSHAGKSFIDEWTDVLTNTRFNVVLISSKMPDDRRQLLMQMKTSFKQIIISDEEQLDFKFIKSVIDQLRRSDCAVRACVSVWEGHRMLMSEVNECLGAPDLTTTQYAWIRDKFSLRKKLNELGISKVKTQILNEEIFPLLINSKEKWFIKPRKGVASFGSFRLDEKHSWRDITRLLDQCNQDGDYKSLLKGTEFIAEEFIQGQEFSFELLAGGGSSRIVAIHEKIELESSGLTTLESACISPPQTLTALQISDAKIWLTNVFAQLNIKDGCFHAEARFHNGRWELIEINCRVGGAYIYHSSLEVSQISLIRTWAELLMTTESYKRASIVNSLPFEQSNMSTFFRVYFAKPGRYIREIQENYSSLNLDPPKYKKIFIKNETMTSSMDREVFAGQSLWVQPTNCSIENLIKTSKDALLIKYA